MSGWMAKGRTAKTHNAEYFGNYEIVSGAQVQESGVPGRYEVLLLSRREMRALLRTVSTPSGDYAFRYLSDHPSGYVLTAFDNGATPATPAISSTPVLTVMAVNF